MKERRRGGKRASLSFFETERSRNRHHQNISGQGNLAEGDEMHRLVKWRPGKETKKKKRRDKGGNMTVSGRDY